MMTTIKTRFFTLAEIWAARRRLKETRKAIAHLDQHLLKDVGLGLGEATPFARR